MSNRQMACDPERIEPFLTQQLADHEHTAFELHLDDCAVCRRQLESTAASDDIWSGIRESLLGQSDDLGAGRSEYHTQAPDDATFAHTVVLDLLAPTDDDRMLGRLGAYEVVGVVGTGGMGVVLKAFDGSLNRYVAIKVLAPHLGSSGAARKRFSREAQAAAAVGHENVIEIHGVAEANGLPYLVMPYVKGPSLQKRLDDDGPLALTEIMRIGMQAANGLAAAHAQGLVHRDVKPANILLADGIERVKLTDFGLARAADDASLTKTGIIAGTPQYMSPEQARGDSIDQRSDLFSLGSVLYAMCTGRSPFRAETSYGMLRRVTDEEPCSIRELNPDIPEWLYRIVSELMSKQPDDRFESASDVATLLEECLAHVQQPTTVSLPDSLVTQPRSRFISGSRRTGVVAMIVALGFSLFGMALLQATAPPEIAGEWAGGDSWGQVELFETGPGIYSGSYTDTFGKDSGKLQFEWSRIERRFKGIWGEGTDRYGTISIRLIDDKIRGGWTTNKGSRIDPGNPELADLLWIHKTETEDQLGTLSTANAKHSGDTAKTDVVAPLDFDNTSVESGAGSNELSAEIVDPPNTPKYSVATEQFQRIELTMKGAGVTNYYPSELCDFTSGSSSERRLREDVISLRVVEAGFHFGSPSPDMKVLHLPDQRVFYIQRGPVGTSKLHSYHGPFYGDPVFKLGLDPVRDDVPSWVSETGDENATPETGSILIHVIDQNGQPIEDAYIGRTQVFSVEGQKQRRSENALFRTDAEGAALTGLRGTPWDLRFRVSKDKFVPLQTWWRVDFGPVGADVPHEFTFRMERGTEIGGVVVDESGDPVAGVTVEVFSRRANYGYPSGFGTSPIGKPKLTDDEHVLTDDEGRWSLHNVPSDESILRERSGITYTHMIKDLELMPLIEIRLIQAGFEQNNLGQLQREQGITVESLRSKSAKIVMQRKPAVP